MKETNWHNIRLTLQNDDGVGVLADIQVRGADLNGKDAFIDDAHMKNLMTDIRQLLVRYMNDEALRRNFMVSNKINTHVFSTDCP